VSRTVEFRGGPYEGRNLPESLVPWSAFIPRRPGDNRPPRNLSREDVLRQPHYRLVELSASRKTYEWDKAA
jgi:hypothetical protein